MTLGTHFIREENLAQARALLEAASSVVDPEDHAATSVNGDRHGGSGRMGLS